MAIVYIYSNGIYERRNEHEVGELCVSDAVDALIGGRGDWEHDEEFRITSKEDAGIAGYGAVAVLIERENEDGEYDPYMIIGGDE